MVTAKVTNITENMRRVSGFLIVIICAVVLHSSCARKVAQSIERTHDTLIVYKTDSVMMRDTIVTVSKMESVDSVADRMTTYVVVDTAGKVLTKYVYRDRSVYHNKDALSASSHVSCRAHRTNSTSHKATVRDAVKKVEKPPARWKLRAVGGLFIIVICVLLYYNIYSKYK
nr:MAG TPA: hypothetical protein [Caudoviricetes sp.]